MKQRFSELTIGQKVLVLIQAGMLLLFLILYLTVGRMEYINFRGEHLRYRTEGAAQIFSGEADGHDVIILVDPSGAVTINIDKTIYGPYIIVEDPTAVPETNLFTVDASLLTGIEIQTQPSGKVLFRGGYFASDSDLNVFFLYDEDGNLISTLGIDLSAAAEPQPEEILEIALDPDPAARGHIYGLLLGALFNLATVFLILYADELFRHNLRFHIQNVEDAEPSDWELTSRWLGWFTFTGCALVLYIIGLNNF